MIPLGVLAGSARVASGPVSDSFNRADGAIGTADSGHVWTAHSGTWNTFSNKAVCVTATDDRLCTVDYAANATIQATTATAGGRYPGLVARFVDTSNLYLLIADPADFALYRKQGGTYNLISIITTANETNPVTFIVTEEAGGTRLVSKRAGVTHHNVLDNTTGRPAGTRVGMRFGFAAGSPLTDASWDDFTAV